VVKVTDARRTLLAAVGVAGIAIAAGVALGFVPDSLLSAAESLDVTLATGLLGAALLGYALRRRRSATATTSQRLTRSGTTADPADPGEAVDDALAWIADSGSAAATQGARSGVRAAVRETAVRAYASEHGVDDERAADAVAAGEWTDDRVAAAFLGDERAPHYPLRERLRGWVQPEHAFKRRAARAADATHALATDATAASAAPTTQPERAEVSR
jgi:hypothetical protein